ncbi:hypothetical protein GCM10027186_00490 [Micromonospora schwarzwaldensis]
MRWGRSRGFESRRSLCIPPLRTVAAALIAVLATVAQGFIAAWAAASGADAPRWLYYGGAAAAMIGAVGVNIMTAVAGVPQLAEDAPSGAHQHHEQESRMHPAAPGLGPTAILLIRS